MVKIFLHTMLDNIQFGKYDFEAGGILRNSLLVSSLLFNSEAWYNVTKAELELIETYAFERKDNIFALYTS